MRRDKRIGFNMKLPIELDDWIEEQAVANCRSKTAEIEFRLLKSREVEQASRATGTPAAGEASRA